METVDFLSPVNTQFALALLAAGSVAYMAVRLSSGRSNRLAKRWPIYVLRSLLLLSLLLLLLNPVRVNEQKGSIEPSQIFFLLDASESMAIGNNNETRWDKAVQLIANSAKIAHESAAADISLFRFGRRLKAVESAKDLGLKDLLAEEGRGVTFVEKKVANDASSSSDEADVSPADEPDTQLFVALRQISSRFGRKPPNAVVVFSDGRARDASRAEQVAAAFSKLKVPVHTVPVGNTKSGGDVALVSLVTPSSARKQSEVNAHAFLRSYGFDGKQVELKLNAVDKTGRRLRRLATVPVTLASGFQSVPISFAPTPRRSTSKPKFPNSKAKSPPTTTPSIPKCKSHARRYACSTSKAVARDRWLKPTREAWSDWSAPKRRSKMRCQKMTTLNAFPFWFLRTKPTRRSAHRPRRVSEIRRRTFLFRRHYSE